MDIKLPKKQIIILQCLSIVFAFIQEVCTRSVLYYDRIHMGFISLAILTVLMIALVIIYAFIIGVISEAKWINAIYICVPFILYSIIFTIISSFIYPSSVDITAAPAAARFLLWLYQWICLLAANFIGIGLRKIFKSELSSIEESQGFFKF